MVRSKGHWGYDDAFMEKIRANFFITAENIETGEIYVQEDASGRVVGFYQFVMDDGHLHMDDLFVEPDSIGQGYGKRLFLHAAARTRELGYCGFTLEADPNAEPFYLRMGLVRTHTVISGITGREVPWLRYDLPDCTEGLPS